MGCIQITVKNGLSSVLWILIFNWIIKSGGVPDGWTTDPITDKQYKVVGNGLLSYTASRLICTANGGFLPEPRTEQERKFLKNFTSAAFWLGAVRAGETFVWLSDQAEVKHIISYRPPIDDCVTRRYNTDTDSWWSTSCNVDCNIVCQRNGAPTTTVEISVTTSDATTSTETVELHVTSSVTYGVCDNTSVCGVHSCVVDGSSFTCLCAEGYENTSPRHCEDVDECLDSGENSSLCGGENHTCVNTNGSYTCRCQKGYENVRPQLCTEVFADMIERSDQRSKLVLTHIEVIVAEIFLSMVVISYLTYNGALLTLTISKALFRWVTTEPCEELDEIEEMEDKPTSYSSLKSTKYREEEEIIQHSSSSSLSSSSSSQSSSSVSAVKTQLMKSYDSLTSLSNMFH